MVREDVLLELNKLLSKLGCNLFFIMAFYRPCITGLLFHPLYNPNRQEKIDHCSPSAFVMCFFQDLGFFCSGDVLRIQILWDEFRHEFHQHLTPRRCLVHNFH